ncbi:40S ribosomal protein S23, putative [Leishmania tarentolae]|uniref:40S ribosomal protein S23, putative n=1 Tax=Leishmania tarentolae TaxID=5689 RepID=A0A640KF78_LEITA|nr:40S ribosomal protein S23, putative [Leishmania tarentolae]GET88366.1 40S ribosomal protein S23, putative [Leishmania tarentolae]
MHARAPGRSSSFSCICPRKERERACIPSFLCTRLLLLLAVQRVQADVRHLHDLEADAGNITDGVTRTAETRYQHLVVFLDKVKAAIVRHERDDLLVVLDQLHTHTLTNGGVRLLGTDTDLLQHNTLGVRDPPKGFAFLAEKVCARFQPLSAQRLRRRRRTSLRAAF